MIKRNNKGACIVIPVYKEIPTTNEKTSLQRVLDLYEGRFDIYLTGPHLLDHQNYQIGREQIPFISFRSIYFQNVFTYNSLLLSASFYKPFRKFHRMLIYQLDAFIFRDMLEEIISWNYDYIGAPWLDGGWKNVMDKKTKTKFFSWFFLQVGNGGFSLRNPKKSYWIARFFYPFKFLWRKNWNEDLFWSTICHRFIPGYKVAPFEKALMFSIEDNPNRAFNILNGQLPFGCHAWEKNEPEFWKPYFDKFGYKMSTGSK